MTGERDERSIERARTAREHDDSDIIDDNLKTPSQQGRSGGALQEDVGTQAAEERVSEPDAHEGVDKDDDIAHGQRYAANRPRDI
jgi:hypothetical protein